MSVRRWSAVAAATLLTLAGFAIPAGTAAAAPACPPVIDKQTVTYTPATVAVTSTGYRNLTVGAQVQADCAAANGADLAVEVILSSHQFDGSLLFEPEHAIAPLAVPHRYLVYLTGQVHSGDLRNSDAGTWTTQLFVTDTDDEVHAYDDVAGPSIKILRAGKVTTKAKAKVEKGHQLTVRGKLSRANWDAGHDTSYGKQPVTLQFRAKGGNWHTVTSTHSSTTGKLKTKIKASKDGWFRFVYGGSATTSGTISATDYVNVT